MPGNGVPLLGLHSTARNFSLHCFAPPFPPPDQLPVPNFSSINASLNNPASAIVTAPESLMTLSLLHYPPPPPSFPVSFGGGGNQKIIDLNTVADIPDEIERPAVPSQQLQGFGSGNIIIAPQPVGSSIIVKCINETDSSVNSINGPVMQVAKKSDEVERDVESETLPAVVSDSNGRERMRNSLIGPEEELGKVLRGGLMAELHLTETFSNNNNNNPMENPSGDELMFDYSDFGFDYPVLNMSDNIQMPPRLPTNHHQLQTPTSILPNMSVVRQFEQNQEVGSTPQAQIESGVNPTQPNQAFARFKNVLPGQPNIHIPSNHGMRSFNQGANIQQVVNIGIGNTQYQSLIALNTNQHLPTQFQMSPTLNTAHHVGNVNASSSTITNQQHQTSWDGNTNGGSSSLAQQQQQASWEQAIGNQQQQASWMPSNAQTMFYRPLDYQIRSSQDMRALSQGTPSPSVVNNHPIQNSSNYYFRNDNYNLPSQNYQTSFPQNQVGGSSMANQQQQLTPTPPSLEYQPKVPIQYTTTNSQYQSPFSQNSVQVANVHERGGSSSSRGNQGVFSSNVQNNVLQIPPSQGSQLLASPQQGHTLMAPPDSQNTNPMITQAGESSRPQQLVPLVQRHQTHQPKTRIISSISRSQSLPKGRTSENRSSKFVESSIPSFLYSLQPLRESISTQSLNINHPGPLNPEQPSASHHQNLKQHQNDPSNVNRMHDQHLKKNDCLLRPSNGPSFGTPPPQLITSGNQQNHNTSIHEPSGYISLRDIGQFQGSNSPSPTSRPSVSNFSLPPPQFTQQEIRNDNVGAIGLSQQKGLGRLFLSPSNNKGKLPMFPPMSMSPRHVNNMLETGSKKADDNTAPSSRGARNTVYDPKYESSTIPIDPHLRFFVVNDFMDVSAQEHAKKRQRTDDGSSSSEKK